MKKKHISPLFFALFFSFPIVAISQQVDAEKLQKEVSTLQRENVQLKNRIFSFSSKLQIQQQEIEKLQKQDSIHSANIDATANSLGIKINDTESHTNQKITELNSSLTNNTLYWIIAFLSALLLSVIVYFLLSKKQKSDKSEVIDQIGRTKKSLEEEQIKLDIKLAEIYATQMAILKAERGVNKSNNEVDHALPLKVADEIVKMQMNISHMDQNVKGIKQLRIAVGNIYDNFKANDYEITDHLNKPYHEGMNMQATMEPDPGLKVGEFIIRRIIKPEVHYKGKMIQNAQAIVAFGE